MQDRWHTRDLKHWKLQDSQQLYAIKENCSAKHFFVHRVGYASTAQ